MVASNAFKEFFHTFNAKFDHSYLQKTKKYPVNKSQDSKRKRYDILKLKKLQYIVLLLPEHYKTATDANEKEIFLQEIFTEKKKSTERMWKKPKRKAIIGSLQELTIHAKQPGT